MNIMNESIEDLVVPPNVTLHVVPVGSPVCVNVTMYEVGGGGDEEVTVKAYVVVLVKPPPEAVTVTVYVPMGVVDDIEMVIVLVKAGFPEEGLKLAEAAEGNPEADRVTV